MSDSLARVLAYHARTKHHLHAYARGPGALDWATQPDPFRRYHGTRQVPLEHAPPKGGPTLAATLRGELAPLPADRRTVSQLFYDSLAVSAWKQAGASRWALRINPSSGNLHPTEGYLLGGPFQDLFEHPVVAHYTPKEHALEIRAELPAQTWHRLVEAEAPGSLLVGLSSVHWREAWKYGERAYRYCQHDVGHAIAAVSIAAAGLGWQTRLLDELSGEQIAALLGVADARTAEPEAPECILAIHPTRQTPVAGAPAIDVSQWSNEILWLGEPNRLSPGHVAWPAIERVAEAAYKPVTSPTMERASALSGILGDTGTLLRPAVHRRRSAVAMDGRTDMPRDDFYRTLGATLPRFARHPFASLAWEPQVHLLVFVHKVRDLAPGLFLLARNSTQLPRLQACLSGEFVWHQAEACPADLPLYRLANGDARALATHLSCHQDIAGESCFSLGMLARFEPSLRERGPWFYPRLFWECGMIGQVLYLQAVAQGLAGTGIGCFFDDAVHEAAGLVSNEFQSLYHFTVGGPLEDVRLSTLPPYPAPA